MLDSVPPPPVLPPTAEAVLTFLDSVGRRSEAELYLRLFRESPRESFAIVAPESDLVGPSGGSIAEQLRYLADLGLVAPVWFGIFDDPVEAPRAMQRLAHRLQLAGLRTVEHEVPEPDLGRILKDELCQGQVPLLAFSHPAGELGVRVAELARLAEELGTRKLVVLRRRGALGCGLEQALSLGQGHVVPVRSGGISVVNLRTDEEVLRQRGLLTPPDLLLLDGIRLLLSREPQLSLQVNVTSPLAMLRELFTVKGAGTLIKRGTVIREIHDQSELQLDRLRALLEASFGAPLVPGFFERPLLAAYVEADYRGAAWIEPSSVAPILSKFAVDPVAQGEGMGRDLWQALISSHPRLIWRARTVNPICSWYAWQCDGMSRGDPWTVYWRGIAAHSIPAAIEEMCRRPHDIVRA